MIRAGVFGFVVVLIGACGAARIVERTPYGGVVALQGDRQIAMQQAQQEMAAQCGGPNYAIVREWEEAVGSESTSRAELTMHPVGPGVVQGGGAMHTSTQEVTEWRMQFQCGPATAASPPGATPPR